MHLLVEILFDVDSKVSVNSSKVAVINLTPGMLAWCVAFLASHAPDCRQQAVN